MSLEVPIPETHECTFDIRMQTFEARMCIRMLIRSTCARFHRCYDVGIECPGMPPQECGIPDAAFPLRNVIGGGCRFQKRKNSTCFIPSALKIIKNCRYRSRYNSACRECRYSRYSSSAAVTTFIFPNLPSTIY